MSDEQRDRRRDRAAGGHGHIVTQTRVRPESRTPSPRWQDETSAVIACFPASSSRP